MIRKPPRLFLALCLWMVLEFCAFALVMHMIGLFGALCLGFATTLTGVGILRNLGRGAAQGVREALAGGDIPQGRMLDGLLTACGAILLILPGFLSDLAGLVLAAPSARQWLSRRFGGSDDRQKQRRPDIIDLAPGDWTSVEKPASRSRARLKPAARPKA